MRGAEAMNGSDAASGADDPLSDLRAAPTDWDLFAALYRVQSLHPDAPGLGRAQTIAEEPLRIVQRPSQRFEPSPLVAVRTDRRAGRDVVEVEQVAFGALGVLGPLPPHVTSDAIRESRAGRPWLKAFLDIFTHRITAFLYRAWEAATPAASRALGAADPFPAWIASLAGVGPRPFRARDAVPDDLRRHAAAWLGAPRRSVAAAAALAEMVIGTRVTAEEFVPEWIGIPPDQQTRIGQDGGRLGIDTVAGARHFTQTQRFGLRTRPLDRQSFAALLPDGDRHAPLRDMMRHLMGLARVWDLTLVLSRTQAHHAALDDQTRLGWNSWLGHRDPAAPLDDVRLTIG